MNDALSRMDVAAPARESESLRSDGNIHHGHFVRQYRPPMQKEIHFSLPNFKINRAVDVDSKSSPNAAMSSRNVFVNNS